MGRNTIPKLFEWRDGKCYQFKTLKEDEFSIQSDDGSFIVYECLSMGPDGKEIREVLGTAYADGLCELMATMFACGYFRGRSEGYENAQKDIRKALGVSDGRSAKN